MVATRSTLSISTPGCPFCYANGKLEVIAHYPPDVPAEQATAYLVLAKDAPNDDDHLVIPGNHAVTEDDLPDDFTAACKYLRWFIPWMEEAMADPDNPEATSYHDGTNYGASSGRKVKHVHKWYSKVPAGHYVAGIATQTHDEVYCKNVTGKTRQEFLGSHPDYGMLVNYP